MDNGENEVSRKEANAKVVRRKMVIVGDGACGKTTLLIVYVNDEFQTSHVPTVFDTYLTEIYLEEEKTNLHLSLWDTAGQEDYDRLRPLSYPDSNVSVLSFAIDNRDSYINGKEKWAPELFHFCPESKKIIVALKCDLREDQEFIDNFASKNETLISTEETIQLKNNTKFDEHHECSSKTKEGVKELFMLIAKMSLTSCKKKRYKCALV